MTGGRCTLLVLQCLNHPRIDSHDATFLPNKTDFENKIIQEAIMIRQSGLLAPLAFNFALRSALAQPWPMEGSSGTDIERLAQVEMVKGEKIGGKLRLRSIASKLTLGQIPDCGKETQEPPTHGIGREVRSRTGRSPGDSRNRVHDLG